MDPNMDNGQAPLPPYSPSSAYPPNMAGPTGSGTAPPVQAIYPPNQVPGYYPNPAPDFAKSPSGYPYCASPPPHPMPSFVVVPSPNHNVPVVPQAAFKSYLAWSIVNLLLFDPLLGIVAVAFSVKARDSLRMGDLASATMYSQRALGWNIAACITGIAGHIAWIAWIIYVFTKPTQSFLSINTCYVPYLC